MNASVTVIVLTYNEEANLTHCLRSVVGWATDVFVLDSGSTDQTLSLAETEGACLFHRPFDTYAEQRTYAVEQLPIRTDWILFLDADEVLHNGIRHEIGQITNRNDAPNGYLVRLRFYFLNRWIRYGGYADAQKLVLFRKSKMQGIERLMNELVLVDGPLATLDSYIIHQDRRPVAFWYEKHVRYSGLQVQEMLQTPGIDQTIRWANVDNRRDRRRWFKRNVWSRLPIWLRPPLYFFQRYVLALGFLDGRAGFIYHFSHAFLYQFMIAAIYTDVTTHSQETARPSEPVPTKTNQQ